jgi:hypothetical protein
VRENANGNVVNDAIARDFSDFVRQFQRFNAVSAHLLEILSWIQSLTNRKWA